MEKLVKIGVIVVSYGHHTETKEIVQMLLPQKKAGDRIVVIDNHPEHETAQIARTLSGVDKAIESDNKGFSDGCNQGAASIVDDVDILLFLNPDTIPGNSVLDTMRVVDTRVYAAWMPLLVLPDGRVNSAGNIVHISGLSWCDGYMNEAKKYTSNQQINVLSGACTAISVKWWKRLGGMDEDYFLYYEDTDLSTRILLAGGRMCLVPQASVAHDYDYAKGAHKWFYLERNRYQYILKTWPTANIILLLPLLLVVELGLWLIASLQGRFVSKLKATVSFMLILPKVITKRREIQATRKISSYEFLTTLHYKIDTPVLGVLGKNRFVELIFSQYYKFCLLILSVNK